jgi:hypothetical protein
LASALNAGTSTTWGICDSFCSQRHSTRILKRIRPNSLKMLRRPAVARP